MTTWLKSIIVFAIQCILCISLRAQSNDSLYYFRKAQDTTLMGVRNAAGKTIIAAKFPVNRDIDFNKPIEDPYIEFSGLSVRMKINQQDPAIAAGEVYDRKGKFLYYPQLYDNGGDYFREGLRRYVYRRKIGFVNKKGEKKISAQWDFATPFNYGYAKVYAGGWKRQFEKGGEHWWITAKNPKAYTYVINSEGAKVSPLVKRNDSSDYTLDGQIYPYPYKYSLKEKSIRDTLNHLDILNDLYWVNQTDSLNGEATGLQFEIVGKPTANFPFYILQGFQEQQYVEEMTFLINKTDKQIFYCADGQQEQAIIPLQKWMEQQLLEARQFLSDHPEMPNSFDVKKALELWSAKR